MPKFYSELQDASLENLGSDPAAGTAGRIFRNTVDSKAKIDTGAAITTIVTEEQTQTLINKTLTSPTLNTPAISSPTGLVKADVGLGSVDNTSDATKNAASVTLTNKTLDAPIIDNGLVMVEEASAPSTPSAGYKKVYPKNDGKLYTLDSAGIELEVGSGGGSGGINYIENTNAETNTSGWATYADAAGTSPVDGTGGAANITLTRDTNSLVIGANSFLITKSAVNRQGEGISYDFTIDTALKNSPIKITNYLAASANFVFGSIDGVTPSDVTVWVYDVTNAVLITPFPNVLTSNIGQFVGSFQATNSTSYRLIYHIGTTNALAWTLALGQVVVGPVDEAFIQADSDYTINTTFTIGASTTPPTPGTNTRSFKTKKNGQELDFLFNYAQTGAGSAGSGTYLIPLPTGLTIDTNIVTVSTNNGGHPGTVLGRGSIANNTTGSSASRLGNVYAYNSTNLMFVSDASTADSSAVWGSSSFNLGGSTVYVSFSGSVAIQGWTSGYATPGVSVQNVPVTFSAQKSAGSFTGDVAIPSWTTTHFDSVGAFNATTGIYTVKIPGTYKIDWLYSITSPDASGARILVNGTASRTGTQQTSSTSKYVSSLLNLSVGDQVSVSGNLSGTLSTASTINIWTMYKVNGPSAFLTINRSTTKYLSASLTSSATNISDLAFSNLIVGKKYSILIGGDHALLATSSASELSAIHNGSSVGRSRIANSNDSRITAMSAPIFEFTATATTLTFNWTETGTAQLNGGSGVATTYVKLTELNNTFEGGF